MESEIELKEIDLKNRTCYNFDDIMKAINIQSGDILQTKNHIKHTKIFSFMTYKKLDGFNINEYQIR